MTEERTSSFSYFGKIYSTVPSDHLDLKHERISDEEISSKWLMTSSEIPCWGGGSTFLYLVGLYSTVTIFFSMLIAAFGPVRVVVPLQDKTVSLFIEIDS